MRWRGTAEPQTLERIRYPVAGTSLTADQQNETDREEHPGVREPVGAVEEDGRRLVVLHRTDGLDPLVVPALAVTDATRNSPKTVPIAAHARGYGTESACTNAR